MDNGWKIYICGGCKERYMVTKHPFYCPYCRRVDSSKKVNEVPIIYRKIIRENIKITREL